MKEYIFTLHVHQIAVLIIAVLCAVLLAYLIGEHNGKSNKE